MARMDVDDLEMLDNTASRLKEVKGSSAKSSSAAWAEYGVKTSSRRLFIPDFQRARDMISPELDNGISHSLTRHSKSFR